MDVPVARGRAKSLEFNVHVSKFATRAPVHLAVRENPFWRSRDAELNGYITAVGKGSDKLLVLGCGGRGVLPGGRFMIWMWPGSNFPGRY